MKDVHEFETLEQLRVLSDPLRMRMARLLAQTPMTTAQLALQLGERLNKVHYHIVELEKAGLVQIVHTRQKGNLIEKVYAPIARRFRVRPALFHTEPTGMLSFFENIHAHLEVTAADLQKAIDEGRVTATEVDRAIVGQVRLHLPPAREAAFRERLEALLAEYLDPAQDTEQATAALSVLFYPLAAPEMPTSGVIESSTDSTSPTRTDAADESVRRTIPTE
jgi:DNA-binding transcriptional ArsR family regulator